ncbi:MAG: hypothetical protein J7M12_04060 [Candidatus Hydrogenedentes bacterium]|nr:hypothetical protein [Candidatus Hydrogenedentota bacterium]
MDNEKLIAWLQRVWNVKERIVFGLMVCVLVFRVYQILTGNVVAQPVAETPLQPIPIPGIEPPKPTPPMVQPPIEEWAVITRKPDMFTEASAGSATADKSGPTQPVVLYSIQKTPRGTMAQVAKVGGPKQYVRQGDVFESEYTVKKIDAAAGTVEVYDSSTKKTYKLTVEKKK